MKPEGPLPRSQESAALLPSLYQINPVHNIPSYVFTAILFFHLPTSLKSDLLPSNFPSQTPYTSVPLPYVPHALPTQFASTSSHESYSVTSAVHEAADCAVLSSRSPPPHSPSPPSYILLSTHGILFFPEPLPCQRGEYGELLIMPANGRRDLTRRLKG